jgi:hypothetical protein
MTVKPPAAESGFFPFLSTVGQAQWKESNGCVYQPGAVGGGAETIFRNSNSDKGLR